MPQFLSQLFIGGAWEDAASGKTFPVQNPANGETLVNIADAGPEDLKRAIDQASDVRQEWAATTALERSHILRKAASIMRRDIDKLAEIMTLEQGKPLDQSRGEINYGCDFLDWFAEEGRRNYGMTIPSTTSSKRIVVSKQAAGVSVAITPWNFPSLQILRKLGAALAAGCPMVVKPAALTPLSALEIGRAFAEAGLPEGVLSVITSAKATAIGDAIMADDRVRVVSFTGSTEVGKILMRGAANTMKRVSLELGGHAPFIVFEDADMDHAIEQALATKMRNMGQTCVSANRFYVQRSIAKEFSERFAARILAMKIGHGNQPGTEVGPLVDAAAVEKVEQHVKDAVAKGATVLIGGKRSSGADFDKGNFYEPTILMGVNDSMIVTYEETFGPVAPIIEFDDEDDVIRQANNSPFGLSAYFFTRDINRITRVSEALDYGTVGINDGAISAVQAPFGGVKESGIGREGGHMGMEEYLDVKYMSIGGLTANYPGA